MTRLQREQWCVFRLGDMELATVCEATQGQRRDQVGSNCPIADTRRRTHTHTHVHSVWDRLPLGVELKTMQYDAWESVQTHTLAHYQAATSGLPRRTDMIVEGVFLDTNEGWCLILDTVQRS